MIYHRVIFFVKIFTLVVTVAVEITQFSVVIMVPTTQLKTMIYHHVKENFVNFRTGCDRCRYSAVRRD